MRRWLSGAYLEALIAGLLFAFDLLVSVTSSWLPVRAMLAAGVVCGGAALSGWRPRIALVVVSLGLTLQLMLPASEVGMSMFACLVPVMSAVSRSRWRWAGLAALVVAVAAAIYTFRDGVSADAGFSAAGWVVVFAIAWALGTALGQARRMSQEVLRERLEQQRRAIAIDLHDNVSHDLAMIAMQVEEARIRGAVAPADLDRIGEAARRSSRYLREVMALLRVGDDPASSGLLELGPTLEVCREDLRKSGFAVSTQGEFDAEALPTAAANVLAKVAREATNNILKHGDRTQPCSLLLLSQGNDLELVFSNAVARTRRRGAGYGLPGMQQRLDAVGGQLKVLVSPGLWVVRATVPLR